MKAATRNIVFSIALGAIIAMFPGRVAGAGGSPYISSDSALSLAIGLFNPPDSIVGDEWRRSASVDSTTMADSTTAFLADSISGRTAWLIRFPNLALDLQSNGSRQPRSIRPREFLVYLDASTGNPLRIVSQLPGYNEAYWFKPSAEQAADQFGHQATSYSALPDSFPATSFARALAVCDLDPLIAEEIVALFVMRKHLGRTPREVWEISFYGVNMSLGIHWGVSGLPRWATDYWTVTIDAKTGKNLKSGNVPSPYPDSSGSALVDSLMRIGFKGYPGH